MRGFLPPKIRPVVLFLFLGLVIFGVWSVLLWAEFVNWDDTHVILQNARVTHFTPEILWSFDPELYIPLTFFTYQVEYAFFGFNAFVFHLDNLLLHIATSLLVFQLLRSLFPVPGTPWLAFFGALFFALHPLQTEAVAWATARKDILATFFFLLTVLAFRRSRMWERERHLRWYLLSIVFFLFALLSKVTVLALPLVFLVFVPRVQTLRSLKTYFPLFPFFALSLLFAMIAAIGQSHSAFGLSLHEFLLLAGARTVFALQKFFFPLHLTILYPAPPISLLSLRYALPLLLLPATLILLARSLAANRTLLLGAALFLLPFLPSLVSYAQADIITLGADRYLYLASIGLLVMLATFVSSAFRSTVMRRASALCATLILCTFSVMARAQAKTWLTSEALYVHLIEEEPTLHIAWNNLGFVYFSKGETEKALPYFQRALELKSDYADAHLNLGAVFARQGDLAQAEEHIRAALAVASNRSLGHYNLGGIHFLRGEFPEAIVQYKIVLQMDRFSARAAVQLAKTYLRAGDEEQAREAYRRAIVIDPAVRGTITELDALLR